MSFFSQVALLILVVMLMAPVFAAGQRFGSPWRDAAPPTTADADAAIPAPDYDARFESSHFTGSANCSGCHNNLRDAQGDVISLGTEWSGSMMANAARDPVFHAKFASEQKRNPALTDVLSEKCLRCHAPMAVIEAGFDGQSLTLLEDTGILDPANPYHDQAMEGVSCMVCHQIEDVPELGEKESFSGGFSIPTMLETSERVAYGQYALPSERLMRDRSGVLPVHSDHMEDSALCATCHELNTPVVDGDGEVVSGHELPEQAVYSEWQQSDFADDGAMPQSCQDCHMERADGVRMANRPRRLTPVDDLKRHRFSGANTVVMDILNNHRAELGVTSGDMDNAIQANREFLLRAADIRITSAKRLGGLLEVRVEVSNRTGHKLPTGYPSRRVWIDFEVRGEDGSELFRSGRMNADGSIVGLDADHGGPDFEPHYRVISNEQQVQVYESVMGDTDGGLTYTLLGGAAYLKDNRIPPAGFDKTRASANVAVVGDALADGNFGDGTDRVTYRVPLPSPGSLQIHVALRYQPLSAGFLNDLFRDADRPLVARFQGYWEDAELRAETLASVDLSLTR